MAVEKQQGSRKVRDILPAKTKKWGSKTKATSLADFLKNLEIANQQEARKKAKTKADFAKFIRRVAAQIIANKEGKTK